MSVLISAWPQMIDYTVYEINRCVSIPMIFVSAIFARLSRQMTRATQNRGQKQSSIAFTFKTKQKVSKKLF